MKHEAKAIGIRLPKDMLSQIEKLSREEAEDRSTMIRKLVMQGYSDFIRERAAQKYLDGRLTLSDAARRAGLTLWEMERHLVEHGYKSSYSAEDLENELRALEKASSGHVK